MNNYNIGDFLIQIKNIAMAGRKSVTVKKTKLILEVAKVLKKEGFLDDVKEEKGMLTASLAFMKKAPVLMDITLISKPGLRIYQGVDEIKKKKGVSMYIISTPKGILSSKEAIKQGVGGEIIAEIL